MIQDLVPKWLIAGPCVITSECEVIHTFVSLNLDGQASLAMTFVTGLFNLLTVEPLALRN
jgi:hypothetical protein